jgi:hypothetical protein
MPKMMNRDESEAGWDANSRSDSVQGKSDPIAIFRELWAINGPFEEPWMANFNQSVWGSLPDAKSEQNPEETHDDGIERKPIGRAGQARSGREGRGTGAASGNEEAETA